MIPRLIHQMFINPLDGSSGGLKDDVLRQCGEWRRHHPHYSYKMWTLPDFLTLCAAEKRPDIAEAVQLCRFPAMQVDIARLLILKANGGFWSDLKLYPLVPFLDLLRNDTLVLAEHFEKEKWHPGLPCSAFLGSRPNNSFFDTALTLAIKQVRARAPNTFGVAGPAALEWALKSHVVITPLDEVRMLPHTATWRRVFDMGTASYNGTDNELHWSRREQRESPYKNTAAKVPEEKTELPTGRPA